MDESKIPAVDKPKRKRNIKDRVPLNGNSRNLLTITNRDPDYEYRWVINDPDRVEKFKAAWWEIDDDPANQRPGDRRIDTSAGTSSIVETKAGGGKKYVLMKLPKEVYEQDQRAKHDEIDRVEAETLREAKQGAGRYGDIRVDRNGTNTPLTGS